jgi:hypothetical protein
MMKNYDHSEHTHRAFNQRKFPAVFLAHCLRVCASESPFYIHFTVQKLRIRDAIYPHIVSRADVMWIGNSHEALFFQISRVARQKCKYLMAQSFIERELSGVGCEESERFHLSS